MDLEYLLFLQNFRHLINDALTPFMELLSGFAVSYLILLPALIYWLYDKRKGLFTFATFCFCIGVNSVVKLTHCIYRPWIRDPRIVPAGDSITSATGYSFPSGHTATAAPLYLGLATCFYKEKKWFSYLCIFLLLLTGFSRNYLGVHTPQDVLFALLEGIAGVYIVYKVFNYVHEHPEKENLILIIEFVLGIIFLIYIHFKPYPMDYVNGELIVDPQKMMNDGYQDIAMMMAYPVSRFIEKTWIKFRPAGFGAKGIILGLLGMVLFFLYFVYLQPYYVMIWGPHWGKFAAGFTKIFLCLAIMPAIIKLVSYFTDKEKTEG